MISWFRSPFGDTLIDLSQGYVPGHFKWILFLPGIAMIVTGILLLYSGYREKDPVIIAGTKP
jgi:ABC-type dipeptide/oligopeptide/nickel transport system permease subunit